MAPSNRNTVLHLFLEDQVKIIYTRFRDATNTQKSDDRSIVFDHRTIQAKHNMLPILSVTAK